ncbi:MAG: protocatechuate 3,4-dioxygenase subunit alpha [Saprospiraceae bacterium]
MERKLQTPSQTVGPYFAYSLTPEQYGYDFDSWATPDLVNDINVAEVITITGQVFDGEGNPVDDAMLEIWQNDKEAQLFGRCGTGTDSENRFIFKTIKPQAVEGNAPFLSVILFMRGALIHLYTRIYFSDEMELNAKDETLQSVPEARRQTLIAQKKGKVYEFNIHMQGEKETVFFDV